MAQFVVAKKLEKNPNFHSNWLSQIAADSKRSVNQPKGYITFVPSKNFTNGPQYLNENGPVQFSFLQKSWKNGLK